MPKTDQPTSPIDISERMVPQFHQGSSIYGEHIARYLAAAELTKGKVVLDIAAGSGYGTQLLAKHAKRVIGIDISEEAVAYAGKNYGAANITFQQGSATAIPLEDASVDMVVTFETIEHLDDYEKFMAEIKRVLKPDGLALISTPNELEFAEGNHYHLHEFEEAELEQLIGRYFKQTKRFYQGTWIYTAVGQPELMAAGESQLRTVNAAPIGQTRVLYFYILASNRAIKEDVTPIGVMSEHWSARAVIAKQALTEQHIKNLEDINRVKEEETNRLQEHQAVLEEKLERIRRSLPYRMWNVLRRLTGRK